MKLFKIIKVIKFRYETSGGYKELLKISFPLILSTASWSVQHFVDRLFLSWYSAESIAASMPAGSLNFTITSLFLGIASYVGVFVSQYFGAKKFNSISKVIWQGIYLSLLGAFIIFIISFFAFKIFLFFGHSEKIIFEEVIYFRILCYGAFFAISSSVLSSYFSGRGETPIVMWVNIAQTIVNIILDYFLIFGFKFFPKMGIEGAGIATVISAIFAFFLYLILISIDKNRFKYNFWNSYKIDFKLIKQIIKFGFPAGIQFFVDMLAFSIFILIIGKLGTLNLAASNIAFNINSIAFMPMIGCGMAVSILVGQYLGANKEELAEKTVYSGFHITILYMSIISFLYIFLPEIFIKPFLKDIESVHNLSEILKILLRYVAFYSIFDSLNIIFGSALKGSGDTKFIMKIIILCSILFLILPSYIFIIVLKRDIFTAWKIVTIYIMSIAISFYFRFKKGVWKKIRVIETTKTIPTSFPEMPSKEFEL